MNALDTLQAGVFVACNAPLHGRAARYYTVGDNTGTALNVIVKPDNWKSMFDTGTADIDFNMIPALICKSALSAAPVEQGRGTVGDTIKFDDFTSTTWHVRVLQTNADYSTAYYDVVLSDYNGPINGV